MLKTVNTTDGKLIVLFNATARGAWNHPPVLGDFLYPNERTGLCDLRAMSDHAPAGTPYMEVLIDLAGLAEYLRDRAQRAVSRKANAVSACVQLRLKAPQKEDLYFRGSFKDGTPYWLSVSWSICNPAESMLAARALKNGRSTAMDGFIAAFRHPLKTV